MNWAATRHRGESLPRCCSGKLSACLTLLGPAWSTSRQAHQKLCREISLELIPVNHFANRASIVDYRLLDPTVYGIDGAYINQQSKDSLLRPSQNRQPDVFDRTQIQA